MLCHSDGVDGAIEKYNLQKVSLLRAVCKSVGIQVLLREYSLDSKTRQSFYEEDIQTVFPVVKHIHPKVTVQRFLLLVNCFFELHLVWLFHTHTKTSGNSRSKTLCRPGECRTPS